MSIAHHPYLSGVPHRIADVRRLYEELLAKPGVVAWDGEQILDWYLAQHAQGQHKMRRTAQVYVPAPPSCRMI